LLQIQRHINFGVLNSTKTYRRHRMTIGIRLDGGRSGIYCAIEASVGGRYLDKPSAVEDYGASGRRPTSKGGMEYTS
jgi:hypothetical protein